MNGFENLGYGVQPLNVAPVDQNHQTLNFYRGLGQQMLDRPLLTVARQSASASPRWIGNLGVARTDLPPPPGYMTAVPVVEMFRIEIEATQTNGGISLVDMLLGQADVILTEAYQTLTFPIEAGGYGLYNVLWSVGSDSERPFVEVAGKVIFSNRIVFRNERIVSFNPSGTVTQISGFTINVTAQI